MLAVYQVCPESFVFAEHLMLAIYQVYAEHPVCAGSGHGLETPRSVLTTLQPAQSGPFSQVLRRAWMPPPHWAVHRSQGPQPVQNMCGGHSKCSLQYLWWGNQEEKEAVQGNMKPQTFPRSVPAPMLNTWACSAWRGSACAEWWHGKGGRCGAGHAVRAQTTECTGHNKENAKLTMQDGASCAAN